MLAGFWVIFFLHCTVCNNKTFHNFGQHSHHLFMANNVMIGDGSHSVTFQWFSTVFKLKTNYNSQAQVHKIILYWEHVYSITSVLCAGLWVSLNGEFTCWNSDVLAIGHILGYIIHCAICIHGELLPKNSYPNHFKIGQNLLVFYSFYQQIVLIMLIFVSKSKGSQQLIHWPDLNKLSLKSKWY